MPSQTDFDVAVVLRTVIFRLHRQMRRESDGLGGPNAFAAILLTTIRREPGIGVNELAARENMRAASMSVHIKQLEAAGWILRCQNTHQDKRRVGLRITDEGERLLAEVRRRRTDWLAGRVATLTVEDRAALRAASAALQQLGEAVNESC